MTFKSCKSKYIHKSCLHYILKCLKSCTHSPEQETYFLKPHFAKPCLFYNLELHKKTSIINFIVSFLVFYQNHLFETCYNLNIRALIGARVQQEKPARLEQASEYQINWIINISPQGIITNIFFFHNLCSNIKHCPLGT